MVKDKFREDVENVRLRLSNRIDQLYTHSNEYKDAGDDENATLSNIKARTLLVVLGDLDRILK